MNTTLPPPRDLPPYAHAGIRARLELAVTKPRRPAWLVPVIAGLAVAVLIASVAWPQAGDRGSRPAVPDPSTAVSTAPPAPGERPRPEPAGVTAHQWAQIEEECRRISGEQDLVLYQVADDAAGKFALLYTPAGGVFECHPGETPLFPEHTELHDVRPLDWLPGPVSIDLMATYSNGGPPAHEDIGAPQQPGLEMAAGRVTSDVARVTYTVNGQTRDGVVANGTYVVRILHSPNWTDPSPSPLGAVHAYDADGEEIATVRHSLYSTICHSVPGGMTVPWGNTADPNHCMGPAVPWR
ncbi:hypothetical protein [Actinophytocola sp.]|uniref:hypothetical protein n=1 Tax=Actinophytocola sp. TaxID=1872138 RepID=UPI003D6C06AA